MKSARKPDLARTKNVMDRHHRRTLHTHHRVALCGLVALLGCDSPSMGSGDSSTGLMSGETTAGADSTGSGGAPSTTGAGSDATSTGGGSGPSASSSSSDAEATGSSDSGSDAEAGSSSGGDDDVPAQALVSTEWTFASNGVGFDALLAVRQGQPAAILHPPSNAELTVGIGEPSAVTVPTNGLTAPALVAIDAASGTLASVRALALPSMRDTEWEPAGVRASDVVAFEDGSLGLVGSWVGTADFFPDTPGERTEVAQSDSAWLDGEPFRSVSAAYEPFVFRLSADDVVEWFVRGQTGPLPQWDRSALRPRNLSLSSAGDLFVYGDAETSWNVTFPSGEAVVLDGPTAARFLGRLDASSGGAAGSTRGHVSLELEILDPETSGETLALAWPPNGSVTLDDGASIGGHTLVSLDAAGMTSLVTQFGSGLSTVARWSASLRSGGVLLVGENPGTVVFGTGREREPQILYGGSPTFPFRQWVAHVDSSGTTMALEWLPDELRLQRRGPGQSVSITDDTGVWWPVDVIDTAWFDAAPEVDISSLALSSDDTLNAVIHVNLEGAVDRTRVLGKNLDVVDMIWFEEDEGRALLSVEGRSTNCAHSEGLLLGPTAPQSTGCFGGMLPLVNYIASVVLVAP